MARAPRASGRRFRGNSDPVLQESAHSVHSTPKARVDSLMPGYIATDTDMIMWENRLNKPRRVPGQRPCATGGGEVRSEQASEAAPERAADDKGGKKCTSQ